MDFDVRLLPPIVTGFGICVTILLWFLNKQRKSLGYRVIKRQPLVSLKGETKKHLEVFFNGQSVRDASIVVLEIKNNGQVPIAAGDYQGQLSISAGHGAVILNGTIIEMNPADLDDRIKLQNPEYKLIDRIERDKLFLRPVLLNSGDSIRVQLLIRNLSGKIAIGGHIQGIHRFKQISYQPILSLILSQSGALIMAGAMLLVQPSSLLRFEIEDVLPYLLMFLLGYVFLSAGTYLPRVRGTMAEDE